MNEYGLALSIVAFGALGAAYSYFVYPLILLLLRDAPRIRADAAARAPKLTLIVAARNEERRIREKLEESLRLKSLYPNMEVLVASDASTDRTDEIVADFHGGGVRLVRTDVNNGKEFAQKAAIDEATGEVIVFTDTGTTIPSESILKIVELFSDPDVGGVSSTDRFIDNDGSVRGEGLYIRYEMWLRELETRKGSLIGLSGSFFAARREVCASWDTEIPSDFAAAINCNLMSLRAISDPGVVGVYRDAKDPGHEFSRKVRTMIRGMTALGKKKETLNAFRFGRLSFQLWSHKVMRWLVPWFGLIYAAGAIALVPRAPAILVGIVLAPVAVLITACALATIAPSLRRSSAIGGAYYLVQVNVAALAAAVQFASGKRVRTWVPTRR